MGKDKSSTEAATRGPKRSAMPELSDDRLYQALSAGRRRRLLYMLLVEESSTVGKLATVLAGWTATESEDAVTSNDYERILTELDHVHLPVLDDAGLVSYDRENGTVEIAPVDDAVAELISRSVESEPPSGP